MNARESEVCAPDEERTLRVLIIDNDEVFGALCARFLRNSPVSYQVVHATSGSDASSKYDLGGFDCVLLDYELPDMTGTAVMRSLQPDPDPQIPIIMLTNLSDKDVVIESLHAGVADYLSKENVTAASLDRAIRNAVDKAALHRTLVQRNIQLEEANVSLTERNEQIQRFCHVMSHEMKTPLTAVHEFISLVLDGVIGEISEKQREVLSMAIDGCDELAGHFNDLIESVRVDNGRLELQKIRSDIVAQLARCVTTVSAIAQRKNIVIGQKLSCDLPQLDMDPVRIRQVVTNLLTNALKFTDDGGLVTIGAAVQDNQYLRVGVCDTGCGIEAAELPRVFDRLHQVRQSGIPEASTGLGLGLSISREIVERHGGSIAIRSEVGSGTTVSFLLPLPQDEAPEENLLSECV